ncbi:Disease resistance protein L6 [Linum perenne]
MAREEQRRVSNQIEALRVEDLYTSMDAVESLANLSELRYFVAESSITHTELFNSFLPNLRWLQLHKYHRNGYEHPLTNFSMKNLVILDLWASKIHDNWGGWSQIEMAERLKVIDLSYCSGFRKLPRFPRSLEILRLSYIEGHEIPELDIGELKKLKVLDIRHSKIQKITGGTFGTLKGLRELDLTNFKCKNLREVMVDVGELSSLKILRTSRKARDVEYETPIGLKVLSTSYRISNLAEMLELEVLKIYDCKFGLEIPPMWWKVSKLKTLWIANTMINGGGSKDNMITTMFPSSLTSLNIIDCRAWLPSLANLGNLTHLLMDDCRTINNHLDGIAGLKSLRYLEIKWVKGLARITGLTSLMSSPDCKLENLAIIKCPDLIELHDDDKAAKVGVVVNSLRLMIIVHCPQLDAGPLVRGLTKFPMLRELWLEKINFIGSIERITSLSKLKEMKQLAVVGAHGLREIEGLGELKCLEYLMLRNCTSLERLWHADDRLENLKSLDIRNCRSLSVEHLSALKTGKISGGTFGMLKELEELDLNYLECSNLREAVADVGQLTSLKILRTAGAKEVEYDCPLGLKELYTSSWISSLAELLELEVLRVYGCEDGLDIPLATSEDQDSVWWKVSKLKYLFLTGTKINNNVSDHGGGGRFLLPTSLISLRIRKCHEPTSLIFPSMENLKNLTRLEVDDVLFQTHLDGLEGLRSLETLFINNVSGLTKIKGLRDLLCSSTCKLESLQISSCLDLNELVTCELDQTVLVPSLQCLSIGPCPHLDVGPVIRGLSKFPTLKKLALIKVMITKEEDLEVIGTLEELDTLELELYPSSLERIPSLSKLKKLESLTLSLPSLRDIEGLGELKSLKELCLQNCESLERLWLEDHHPQLCSLGTLNIRNCKSLSVDHLSALKTSLPPGVAITWPDHFRNQRRGRGRRGRRQL